MSVNKQLEILLEELGVSQREFARETSLSNQTVNNIIAGRHVTKSDIIEKILTRYPDLNMNWFFTGIGQHWTSENGKRTIANVLSTGTQILMDQSKEIEHLKEIIKLKDEIIEGLKAQIKK